MATVEELNKKQAAERRTALLGLAAGRHAGQLGDCLTSSDMGELLDDNCSAEQRQRFLVHLASCDSCYREWLELQQFLEEKISPVKPLLFRRKVLTVTGSLLAAAASVIFYLNVDNSPGPHGPPLLSFPEADPMIEESLERPRPPAHQKTVQKRVFPAPAEMEKHEFAAAQLQSDAVAVKEKKGVTVKDDTVQSFSRVSNQADGAPLAAAAMAMDPVHLWLQQVAEKCSGLHSGQEWSILAQQGRELPLTGQVPQLPAIVDHVERLAGGGEYEIECAAIKRIVKENHDNETD